VERRASTRRTRTRQRQADVGIEEVVNVALERQAALIALIQPKKSAVLLLASETCSSAHQVRDAERDDDADHNER